jgi:hypothetical protein
MKLAIALLVVLSLASNAYAGCPRDWANPPPTSNPNPNPVLKGLGNYLSDVGAGLNPEAYERKQREEAARATYRALLLAGAPEETACAAALNPDFFRIVAPQYLRPQR